MKKKVLIDRLETQLQIKDNIIGMRYVWRSEIDPNWKPMVWNETFECWTKDYCG